MKKISLLVLILHLYLSSLAVEPWSGIGVVYFKCHYPEMTEKSINIDIFDSTLTKKILSINSKDYYRNKSIELIEFADEVKGLCMSSIHDNAIKVILRNSDNQIQYGWLKKDNKGDFYKLNYC